MVHKPVSRDPGHGIIGRVHTLSAVELKRETQRFGDLFRRCGTERGRGSDMPTPWHTVWNISRTMVRRLTSQPVG
jgi:hypothetical protein